MWPNNLQFMYFIKMRLQSVYLESQFYAYKFSQVRNSDQSVIQFLYGEDGMDIFKSQFFNPKQLQFLQDNAKCIIRKDIVNQLEEDADQKVRIFW